MDRSTLDLYGPEFWFALALAVLVLMPIVGPRLRKWTWAAINVAFLGGLLGGPDWYRVGELLRAGALADAANLIFSSGLGIVVGGVVLAWLVFQAIQWLNALHMRWLKLLPLAIGALGVLGLFLMHKLSVRTLYRYDEIEQALAVVGLSRDRVQPLKIVLVAIGFSYVALRMVEALRLTYEGRHPAPDLPSTVNYLLPFHMLAAGPIQAYADFVEQPAVPPPLTASNALRGVERIAHGLFKKYVLAMTVDKVFLNGFKDMSSWYVGVEMVLFYFWIYLDFSAYSDITVGAGRLLGVATPENFNCPYVARNLVDFWDRWHMSLSRFIYRNLFIPVQLSLVRRAGPRHALACGAVAFMVAFLLCGVWHELNIRWLLWGFLNAAGLIAVNVYRTILQRVLTREQFNRYRASRGWHVAGSILTQVFFAFTLLVANWPRQ